MTANEEPADLGTHNGHEIYPMPMFVTIAVDDVAAVADWYVTALGFSVVFSTPGPDGQPAMVHLRRRKYQDVLVVPGAGRPSGDNPPASLAVSFSADDLDELASRARSAPSRGSASIEGPVDTPWNSRDLRVVDPSGNRLVFTSRNMNASPEQLERVRKMLEAGRK